MRDVGGVSEEVKTGTDGLLLRFNIIEEETLIEWLKRLLISFFLRRRGC